MSGRMAFELAEIPEGYFNEPSKPRAMPGNCPGCGRFAKYLSTTHYYNGNYDCIRIEVLCKQCGQQGIECV